MKFIRTKKTKTLCCGRRVLVNKISILFKFVTDIIHTQTYIIMNRRALI